MYYSPLCLQVDMLQDENETIFDKVMWSSMFFPYCEWTNISYKNSSVF